MTATQTDVNETIAALLVAANLANLKPNCITCSFSSPDKRPAMNRTPHLVRLTRLSPKRSPSPQSRPSLQAGCVTLLST